MKNKILILVILAIFISCKKNDEIKEKKIKDIALLINDQIIKFHETNDYKHLDKAYNEIKSNKVKLDELMIYYPDVIIPLLMNLSYYDELEDLLLKNKSLNDYYRLNSLNVVKYLKNKNRLNSKSYLFENIKRINDSLSKNPTDSLRYMDYFLMKMYLNGRKQTIIEIDSMKNSNKIFSSVFYEILTESIEAYPIKE